VSKKRTVPPITQKESQMTFGVLAVQVQGEGGKWTVPGKTTSLGGGGFLGGKDVWGLGPSVHVQQYMHREIKRKNLKQPFEQKRKQGGPTKTE